jgi:hypothetical protein
VDFGNYGSLIWSGKVVRIIYKGNKLTFDNGKNLINPIQNKQFWLSK